MMGQTNSDSFDTPIEDEVGCCLDQASTSIWACLIKHRCICQLVGSEALLHLQRPHVQMMQIRVSGVCPTSASACLHTIILQSTSLSGSRDGHPQDTVSSLEQQNIHNSIQRLQQQLPPLQQRRVRYRLAPCLLSLHSHRWPRRHQMQTELTPPPVLGWAWQR